MGAVQILCVCTANICRSPAAADLLRGALSPLPLESRVASAGVAAEDGWEACRVSEGLVRSLGSAQPLDHEHRSRRVTVRDVEGSDLIIALDRSHRGALAQLSPRSRPRTFTLRHAALLAEDLRSTMARGELPEGAPAPPDNAEDRFRWWVAELDAGRSLTGESEAWLDGLLVNSLDVPDPHVVGFEHHALALNLVANSIAALSASLQLLLQPAGPGR